jgi:hypothetical protein
MEDAVMTMSSTYKRRYAVLEPWHNTNIEESDQVAVKPS